MSRLQAKWDSWVARLGAALEANDMALHERLKVRFLAWWDKHNQPRSR